MTPDPKEVGSRQSAVGSPKGAGSSLPPADSLLPTAPAARGKPYWRSLEELADTEQFREFLHREFPDQASEWTDLLARRQFLTLLGASSLALAGVSGCASSLPAPVEKIMPYVRPPDGLVLGKPLYFATAMTLGGTACGLLVQSREGRPIKVEGNPRHPASPSDYHFGPSDTYAQASVLEMYDPDRSQTVNRQGRITSWSEIQRKLQEKLRDLRRPEGAGLRILTPAVVSPTLAAQLEALLDPGKGLPQARWCAWEPAGRDNVREGAVQAFGQNVNTYYQLANADVILALDSDFLSCGPGNLRYARDFTERRRVAAMPADKRTMNRLYVVEPMPTGTGAKADHRLRMRAQDVENFARAVAAELASQLRQNPLPQAGPESTRGLEVLSRLDDQPRPEVKDVPAGWIRALVEDLLEEGHRRRSLILAGDGQSPAVHALVHAMNLALGNVGRTVISTAPVDTPRIGTEQTVSLPDLVKEMEAGQVEVLLILGGNPAWTAPADVPFAEQLGLFQKNNEKLSIHLGLYDDETAALCHWHVPQAHYLESWSDARAFEGTATIVQPLIAPLYGGKSAHDLLAALTDNPDRSSYDLVREFWLGWWQKEKAARSALGNDFEAFWRKALHEGVVPETKFAELTPPPLKDDWVKQAPAETRPPDIRNLEVVFRPDAAVYDGRFANNGWLQELPRPITRLTWGNAAILSPKTAADLGFGQAQLGYKGGEHGQAYVEVIELRLGERTVEAPVWIQPGHADDSITVHLGYGRTRAGRVGGNGDAVVGFNAYQVRTADNPWIVTGVKAPTDTGKREVLASCQQHHNIQDMEARGLIENGTLANYPGAEPEPPNVADKTQERRGLTLYHPEEFPYTGYRWGMAIDLTACTGCSACVVACQAENNIPVVGKEQVVRGREMHWLRIDSYYKGADADVNPEAIYFQPVPCMHCENAPCEVVCPVGATVHSQDGLNDMVYNRCVGTRYCSNNCPYKVRRFNFLQYADYATESLKLRNNPEVTVRSRGVMEKCTYCIQRIRAADIDAEKRMVTAREQRRAQGLDPDDPEVEQRHRIQDGEVLTACQSACPAHAIVFGDMNDPGSEVSRLKAQPLNYRLLEELNTRPRTSYLAAVRNPNPRIQEIG